MKRPGHDDARIARVQHALGEARLDAVAAAHPPNVLLLSGYWPVVGTSIVIATQDGRIALLVPEDEEELASECWADEIRTFRGGSLNDLKSTTELIEEPFASIIGSLGLKDSAAVGYEADQAMEPSTYVSMFLYGSGLRALLQTAFSKTLMDASPLLERLRSVLTRREIANVRSACAIAGEAYIHLARELRSGMREYEVAAFLGVSLSRGNRTGGFAFCMSGPNSAQAAAAYQISRDRLLHPGEFALVHCNSYMNGFWTDITRTFTIGDPDGRQAQIYRAVFEAGKAARAVVRPGIPARDVDSAARQVMEDYGFGPHFTHATGHGVGFAAINHNALPRIHPLSDDVLEVGMVFNIEPAAYFDGYGGVRHCDMVCVAENGVESLTPFLVESRELAIALSK